MLRLDPLEPRLAPARVLFAASGGVVYERVGQGWEYRATTFESDVPASLSTDGERVFVGAGPGGAPRVVTYDRGWNAVASVFVGDPESRAGVSLVGFDRPSAGLRANHPGVQSYLDRVPPLAVDLSGVTVTVHPAGTQLAAPGLPAGAVGYYAPIAQQIHIRADYARLVLHEVGHAVGFIAFGDPTEDFARDFAAWVDGTPDPRFDALRL
jgi:hypothetical protein